MPKEPIATSPDPIRTLLRFVIEVNSPNIAAVLVAALRQLADKYQEDPDLEHAKTTDHIDGSASICWVVPVGKSLVREVK